MAELSEESSIDLVHVDGRAWGYFETEDVVHHFPVICE